MSEWPLCAYAHVFPKVEATVTSMSFNLPWPPKVLSPNARAHYMAKARSLSKYRGEARVIAKSVLWALIAPPSPKIDIVFWPPDKRRRDLDNCLASFKSGLDGIADALGVNDAKFKISISMGEPVKYGEVHVTIS